MTKEKTEIEKLNLNSMNVAKEKQNDLLRLFPEIRTEGGKFDFEKLKLVLGEIIDCGKERYGMVWPGKAECFKNIQTPSMGTLLPAPNESINFGTSSNLIIEGDNLEVLKLLQKSYLGQIKMIYIDPPYNTGNDFIYPDNYTESLKTYLQYTGQIDNEGHKFGTNSDTDGRFHSKWMNMIFPRLYLSKNLLRDDGVIFVSINDAELSNLRKVMDDIYGEENFIGTLIWKSRHNVDSRNKTSLSSDHEYVVVYGSKLKGQGIDKNKYSNPDNDPRGPWMSDNMVGLATKEQRPNLHYDLVNPETRITYSCPEKGWRYDRSTMATKVTEGRVLWPAQPEGRPRHKKFLAEVRSEFTGFSSLLEVPNTAVGTQEIRDIFGEALFDFPKPSGLVRTLVLQGTNSDSNDIILDFFAGSGTTGQAVIEANISDGGNRKFILIQLPEVTGREDYKTIADITRGRIKKIIDKYKYNEETKLIFDLNPENKIDMGFRSFKLSESNFKTWSQDTSKENLEKQLELHVDHVKHDCTADDILYEILLKSGFPLTTKVEIQKLSKQTVYSIAGGMLLVCLEDNLILDLIKYIAEQKPERVVCLDQGFSNNDQLKANAVQIFRTKGIASFKTV